jgi:hypothetical protein
VSLAFFFERSRGSVDIRGFQIAERLGAKINPDEPDPSDTCIFVKMSPRRLGQRRQRKYECAVRYLDVVDAPGLLKSIRMWRGHLGVIVTSRPALAYVKATCPMVPVVCIPQHHCNYERERRTRTDVSAVGIIGMDDGKSTYFDELAQQMAARGLTFLRCPTPITREAVVDFYRTIDIQIMWRTILPEPLATFKNALRLANAGSFGIPTIARPEAAIVDEFEGAYLPANSVQEVVDGVDWLRAPDIYDEISSAALQRSEPYHIDNVAVLYRQLEAAA